MVRGFRYSRWDGTQVGFDLDADTLLDDIADDLMYHGDVNAALRRAMQDGLQDRDGRDLMGLREMIERLRQARRDELDRRDLGGVYEDIAQRLEDVVEQERAGIDDRQAEADASGDPRRRDLIEQVANERRRQLDELSPDLAGRVQEMQRYEFMDDGARQAFEDLMDELKQQLMQNTFNQLSEGMSNMTPEQMAGMKDMLADLNRMLEERAQGNEPDFDAFMEKHGRFFPENPRSLDELLEQMARSMAAMQQILNSMTPEQRAQIEALSEALLEDMDLRWQMDSLSRNLQDAFPNLPWDQRMNFRGDDPVQFGELAGLMQRLGDLDELENLMRSATQPGQLAEVDLDKARRELGDDAAHSLDRLAKLAKTLEDAGLIEQREGRFELTPRAIRAIGRKALGDLYKRLLDDRGGRHQIERTGVGHERAYEHKPYEYGDPFNLNVEQTIRNALRRTGPGTPVRITPDDFEVERTEQITRSATVLLLDCSMSMPMRDNWQPAKKMAMALHALITSQFPRDFFGLVSFGRVAREVKPEKLPELSWDFEWGTNMQHALLLARRMLARESGTKQIIMVTDGEPTAHIERGEAFFEYPPSPWTIEETMKEVMRVTREDIRINTFMIDDGGNFHLRDFVEKMMSVNRGRAFFTAPDTLGDYVLVDFLEHRRQRRAG